MAQMRKIGTVATTVKRENGTTRVQYHRTVVVEFNDEKITLNSGGWRTNTTKTRMNQTANQFGLGFSVQQTKGVWYVHTDMHGTVPFTDGMTIKRIDENKRG